MQKPRGTRDLSGEELKRIRHVEKILRKIFKIYGYQEIETPVFENLELFTKKSGSEVIEQIYEFEDKSGRKLALRPELTAPVVRLYNNQLKVEPKPLKVSYSGPCFRYERKQAKRWRQFSQAGVELIGTTRPESDAEIISLTKRALNELNLSGCEIKIGHIGILREYLKEKGIQPKGQDPILREIDSGDESRIEEELNESKIEAEAQQDLMELIKLKGGTGVLGKAEKILDGISEAIEAINELRNILDLAEKLEVSEFEIDLGISRGLEYYTGFVIEIYFNGVQLGGGGRYDNLIEALGGEPTPAVGIGFGIDRIARILGEQDLDFNNEYLKVMIIPINEEMLGESLSIAKELREKGISTDLDLMGRNLSKALSYADSRNAEKAIIVGPEDLVNDEVTIKDMESGDQRKLSRGEILSELNLGN